MFFMFTMFSPLWTIKLIITIDSAALLMLQKKIRLGRHINFWSFSQFLMSFQVLVNLFLRSLIYSMHNYIVHKLIFSPLLVGSNIQSSQNILLNIGINEFSHFPSCLRSPLLPTPASLNSNSFSTSWLGLFIKPLPGKLPAKVVLKLPFKRPGGQSEPPYLPNQYFYRQGLGHCTLLKYQNNSHSQLLISNSNFQFESQPMDRKVD